MSQFEEFCKKLGDSYKNNYYKVCVNEDYNKNKALDDSHTNAQQYIQAASEQIYYYWLKSIDNSVDHDVIVNSPKDVDIYSDGSDYKLRIEVKTPEIEELKPTHDESVIKIKIDHRYDNLKPNESPSLKVFIDQIEMIKSQVNPHKEETGKTIEMAKNDDLKIKTFLESANEKFVKSDDKTINVLLICLDTMKLGEFFDYIKNPWCGLFSSEPYIKIADYPNVDFIILSNCCEAHFDINFTFNAWNAENYFNFAIPLRCDELSIKKKDFIAKLFNEQMMEFLDNYNTKYNPSEGSECFLLHYLKFIEKNYPHFIPNKSNRKY